MKRLVVMEKHRTLEASMTYERRNNPKLISQNEG